MAAGSTAISFGGLVIRNIEHADEWQLVFYRAIGMLISISIILMLRYRRHTIFRIRDIGWPGVIGSLLVATASISFVQSITHTTVANSLFMLCAIPFISAALARVFLKEALPGRTIYDGARRGRYSYHVGRRGRFRIDVWQRDGPSDGGLLCDLRGDRPLAP